MNAKEFMAENYDKFEGRSLTEIMEAYHKHKVAEAVKRMKKEQTWWNESGMVKEYVALVSDTYADCIRILKSQL